MKQVQDALKNIGIPVMAGVWRATTPSQNPPLQYAVYSTTMTEASHQDDSRRDSWTDEMRDQAAAYARRRYEHE